MIALAQKFACESNRFERRRLRSNKGFLVSWFWFELGAGRNAWKRGGRGGYERGVGG